MKKKLSKKLKLNKEFITSLSKEESKKVLGGFTTSYGYCTGALCCGWTSDAAHSCNCATTATSGRC